MQNTTKATFSATNANINELLIAQLSEAGYDAFEELDSQLIACGNVEHVNQELAIRLAAQFEIGLEVEVVPHQNWNAKWESDFDPVIVGDFCTIRAHFHALNKETQYEVVITPKMTFGTGHHATTQLMVEAMKLLDIHKSKVLDFGTGTGVLAILAAKMGAESVFANEVEDWSVANANENANQNDVCGIKFVHGSLEQVHEAGFNVILANINLHILKAYMPQMSVKLASAGKLLISGILEENEIELIEVAKISALIHPVIHRKNGWSSIIFSKSLIV